MTEEIKNLARPAKKETAKPKKILFIINFILLFILVLLIGMNQMIIAATNDALGIKNSVLSQITSKVTGKTSLAGSSDIQLTGDLSQDAVSLVISKGIPKIYGTELSVTFDQVQQSMNILGQFDPTYGQKKIVLTSNDLKRYTDIGLRISCEYCCGATSIVNKDGKAACGCAHSQAMRGLAAYLIKNHNTEYSDDQILRELARWKGVFFPKQMIQKLTSQLQNGGYTSDTAALILGLKMPSYGQGSATAPLPSDIKNLPSMVGGC